MWPKYVQLQVLAATTTAAMTTAALASPALKLTPWSHLPQSRFLILCVMFRSATALRSTATLDMTLTFAGTETTASTRYNLYPLG